MPAASRDPHPAEPVLPVELAARMAEVDRIAARRVAEALPRVPAARMAEVDKILYGDRLEGSARAR